MNDLTKEEYIEKVKHHHIVLNKACENHISDCRCNDCVIRSDSALIIRENRPRFIGLICKCDDCLKRYGEAICECCEEPFPEYDIRDGESVCHECYIERGIDRAESIRDAYD